MCKQISLELMGELLHNLNQITCKQSKLQWEITIKEDFNLKSSANQSQSHQLWLALITTTVLQAKLAFARLTIWNAIKQLQIIKVKSSNPKIIRIARITNITLKWINLQIALQVDYHDKVRKDGNGTSKLVQTQGNHTSSATGINLNHTTLRHASDGTGKAIGYNRHQASLKLSQLLAISQLLPKQGVGVLFYR